MVNNDSGEEKLADYAYGLTRYVCLSIAYRLALSPFRNVLVVRV